MTKLLFILENVINLETLPLYKSFQLLIWTKYLHFFDFFLKFNFQF
jgi:hypothetical protein